MEQQNSAGPDIKGEVLKPSIVNTWYFRIGALLGTLALAAEPRALLSQRGLAFLHLFTFSLGAGALTWVTFVSGIVMFKNMPRTTFGRVQSRLFPIYFAWTTIVCAIQMVTIAALVPSRFPLIVLSFELVSALANWLWIEPLTSGVMFRRYALEKATDDRRDAAAIKDLYRKFTRLHGISSVLNLIALMAGLVHGWYLSGFLKF